jgi:nucleoside-diphosphate-sugar epimerase
MGHALARAFGEREVEYRVVGRNLDTLTREFPQGQAVRADFLSDEGVDAAAAGVETILYLAGAPYDHFEQHPVMTRNALQAAQRAGTKRFAHVAPVYSYGPARSNPVPESQPHVPNTRKGRYRLEQEQAVENAHGVDGLQTLILHLPDFYGPNADNSIANYFMREAIAGKSAPFIGSRDGEREFLYVPDAAEPFLRLVEDDGAYGRCWNLGGVAPIAAADFARLVFEALGTKPRVQYVPKIGLQAFGLFNPTMRELAEMYYLSEGGFILDDSELIARTGGARKTPYAQGISETIAWMRHP